MHRRVDRRRGDELSVGVYMMHVYTNGQQGRKGHLAMYTCVSTEVRVRVAWAGVRGMLQFLLQNWGISERTRVGAKLE